MAEARLQVELEESKQEIRRLRERLSLGTPSPQGPAFIFPGPKMVRCRNGGSA